MFSFFSFVMALCASFALLLVAEVHASPLAFPVKPALRFRTTSLSSRLTEPYFPEDIVSCQKCSADYGSIQNCAEAAPVLANFTMIIFNPGAFIDVIQCACTETFQAVFPQCVDCFQQTNQTDVLSTDDLPSVVSGMRQICALESTLIGGAASANGEIPSATTSAAPVETSNAALSLASLPTNWSVGCIAVMGLASLLRV